MWNQEFETKAITIDFQSSSPTPIIINRPSDQFEVWPIRKSFETKSSAINIIKWLLDTCAELPLLTPSANCEQCGRNNRSRWKKSSKRLLKKAKLFGQTKRPSKCQQKILPFNSSRLLTNKILFSNRSSIRTHLRPVSSAIVAKEKTREGKLRFLGSLFSKTQNLRAATLIYYSRCNGFVISSLKLRNIVLIPQEMLHDAACVL